MLWLVLAPLPAVVQQQLPSLPGTASHEGTNQAPSCDLRDVSPCLQPSQGQHCPKPSTALGLLLFPPMLHSLSNQEPTFLLLCCVQLLGFKTQSLVTFEP